MTRKNSLYVLSTDATVAGRTDCTEHVSNDATAFSEHFLIREAGDLEGRPAGVTPRFFFFLLASGVTKLHLIKYNRTL